MSDQFSTWDKFMRHYRHTKNPYTALRWTRYEEWAEKRLQPFKELEAEMELKKSLDRLDGVA